MGSVGEMIFGCQGGDEGALQASLLFLGGEEEMQGGLNCKMAGPFFIFD
jgi:hypothetical protein